MYSINIRYMEKNATGQNVGNGREQIDADVWENTGLNLLL